MPFFNFNPVKKINKSIVYSIKKYNKFIDDYKIKELYSINEKDCDYVQQGGVDNV